MRHHHIYRRKVWDRVLGYRACFWCTLVRRVVAVFVAEVWESPIAELGLVWRCVNLESVNSDRSRYRGNPNKHVPEASHHF
jgi:hypothetical protein